MICGSYIVLFIIVLLSRLLHGSTGRQEGHSPTHEYWSEMLLGSIFLAEGVTVGDPYLPARSAITGELGNIDWHRPRPRDIPR